MSDYWSSPEGLDKRLDALADSICYASFNNAVQAYGNKNNVWGFEWVGYTDSRTCDICDAGIGRQFRLSQFMRDLPIHVSCRCSWRLIPKGLD